MTVNESKSILCARLWMRAKIANALFDLTWSQPVPVVFKVPKDGNMFRGDQQVKDHDLAMQFISNEENWNQMFDNIGIAIDKQIDYLTTPVKTPTSAVFDFNYRISKPKTKNSTNVFIITLTRKGV